MLILQSLLVIAQGVIAVAMIALILLQHGRGADAGASFGSGSSSTVFGSRGPANLLSRSTAVLAALFVINCLTLAYLAREQAEAGGVMQGLEAAGRELQEDVPVVPDGAATDAGPALELPDVPAIPGAAEAPAAGSDADTVPTVAEPAGQPAQDAAENSP